MLRDFNTEGYQKGGPLWQQTNSLVRQAIADDMSYTSDGKMPKKWLKHVSISDKNTDEMKVKKLGGLMSMLVSQASRSRIVRDVARAIVRGYGVEPKDYPNEFYAIQHWIQTNIRYTFDTGEQFQTPQRILMDWSRGYDGADCDCVTILYLSLLKALGHIKLAIGLVDSKGDGVLSHAIGLVKLPRELPPWGNKWIPAELTKEKPLGWFPDKATKCIAIPVAAGLIMSNKVGGFR